MLQIIIPEQEGYTDSTNEFGIVNKKQILQLEHSLVSLSKWESTWCKPFLSKVNKTPEETIDYIRCMTITQNVDSDVYQFITQDNILEINKYIDAPMTATTFSKDANKATNREVITAEIIYYWMIALTIPFECQKWHLNRLLTLINVCNIKNQPKKKTNQKDLLAHNRALNESRKLALNTPG
jgi:hypothetical protein